MDAKKVTSDAEFPYMAFRCGQNIHIIKYEMENTKNLPNGANESNCRNTKKSIKIIKFEVEGEIKWKSN